MDLSPASGGRMWVALLVLGALAFAVWGTMEPGRYRALVWILLGFFAARVVLGKLKTDAEARRRQEKLEG